MNPRSDSGLLRDRVFSAQMGLSNKPSWFHFIQVNRDNEDRTSFSTAIQFERKGVSPHANQPFLLPFRIIRPFYRPGDRGIFPLRHLFPARSAYGFSQGGLVLRNIRDPPLLLDLSEIDQERLEGTDSFFRGGVFLFIFQLLAGLFSPIQPSIGQWFA